jgi:hypothetical protein
MNKKLKDLLLEPQIANADTAKREQLLIMTAVLVFILVVFALKVYGSGN